MIDATHVHNMPQLLEALEHQLGRRIILKFMEGQQVFELSAEAFFAQARCLAAVLAARNLRGRHIGIVGANRVEWLAGFCAVFLADAVAVLLSPDLSSQELADRTAQADLGAILFDDALRDLIRGQSSHRILF